MKIISSESNDLDTIYKVLKKAGEMSDKSKDTGGVSSSNRPTQMDIPDIHVPDYPDRTPKRGPNKVLGPIPYQQKQGSTLSAPPVVDISSSGPQNMNLPHKKKKRFKISFLYYKIKKKKYHNSHVFYIIRTQTPNSFAFLLYMNTIYLNIL